MVRLAAKLAVQIFGMMVLLAMLWFTVNLGFMGLNASDTLVVVGGLCFIVGGGLFFLLCIAFLGSALLETILDVVDRLS